MGYLGGLDEHSEKDLRAELRLRRGLRRKGLCDYCARVITTSPCKFPDRHAGKKEREPVLMRFLQFLRFRNKERFVLPSSNLQRVIDDFRKDQR